MKNKIKKFYKELKEGYNWKMYKVLTILFLASSIIAYIIINNVEIDWEMTFKKMIDLFPSVMEDQTVHERFLFILLNNLQVSFIVTVLGMIPLIILPAWVILSNGAIIGAALGLFKHLGANISKALFIGIIPHGITEVGGLILGVMVAIHLSKDILEYMRKRMDIKEFKKRFKLHVKTYFTIIVPMVIVSALIESYITSYLVEIYGIM
mgnify:CR=1 FL=1